MSTIGALFSVKLVETLSQDLKEKSGNSSFCSLYFIFLKLSPLFEHAQFSHFIYFLLFWNAALLYLVNERTLYISAIIHICSVLCYVTINIVKKFLNHTEFI